MKKSTCRCFFSFVAIASVCLYQTSINKWVVYAEPVCLDNLIYGGETVNRCLIVYILLYLFRFFFLPRSFYNSRNNCIYYGSCYLELFFFVQSSLLLLFYRQYLLLLQFPPAPRKLLTTLSFPRSRSKLSFVTHFLHSVVC